jgi:hypothetical protein
MNYKTILFGILFFLTVLTVASAQAKTWKSKGKSFPCIHDNSPPGCTKTKASPNVSLSNAHLDAAVTMTITDSLSNAVIATLVMQDYFDTSSSTGAFSFVEGDGTNCGISENCGIFIGTFKNSATDEVTSFTGTLIEIFADGNFETLTFKTGTVIAP